MEAAFAKAKANEKSDTKIINPRLSTVAEFKSQKGETYPACTFNQASRLGFQHEELTDSRAMAAQSGNLHDHAWNPWWPELSLWHPLSTSMVESWRGATSVSWLVQQSLAKAYCIFSENVHMFASRALQRSSKTDSALPPSRCCSR